MTTKRRMKYIYKIILSLILICLIITWLYCAIFLLKVKEDTSIIIPSRTSVLKIANLLKNKGIEVNQYIFYIVYHLQSQLYHKKIQSGEYQISKGDNILHILNKLMSGKVIQHKITIPEGYTISQIINLLKKNDSIISSSSFYDIKLKEGYFLPDTYNYTYGITDFDILYRMNNGMILFIEKEWSQRDKKIDEILLNIDDVIILASIVEKEAIFDDEKPIISGVYLNRLKKGMKLQADPTVIYGITTGKTLFNRKVTYNDLKHNSRHNTYMNFGLPPSAICNPGKKALSAVLHPKWHQYLFFVANSNGRHIFSPNYLEHKLNIKQVRNMNNN